MSELLRILNCANFNMTPACSLAELGPAPVPVDTEPGEQTTHANVSLGGVE